MEKIRGLKAMSTFRNSRHGIKSKQGCLYSMSVPVDLDGAHRVAGRLDMRDIMKELDEGTGRW